MAGIPEHPEDQELVRFHVDGTDYRTHTTRKWRERRPWVPTDRSAVTAQIPGLVLKVLVAPGQRIERGQGVVVLEAMKMANEVASPWSGRVKSVLVSEGQTVPRGTVLVELE